MEHEGEMVCMSGAFTPPTRERCGRLRNTNFDWTVDGRHIFKQRLATYVSIAGDSGAPIYRRLAHKKARAVGLHSGIVTINGRIYRVYTHASLMQSNMDIALCAQGRVACGR
jgi:hypothetical protein